MGQRSILRSVAVRGRALHTGQEVTVRVLPAPANGGICFRRVDLLGRPELRPDIGLVGDLVRCTTLASGEVRIHTVEHLLSAVSGLAIDNILVEIDGEEPPILDGSAKEFANLLQQAEIVEQNVEKKYYVLDRPICVSEGNRTILAIPYDGLKITCTSADDRGFHTQHLSLDITPESYFSEIAPARTFTLYEDIEPLLQMGKIQGGSLDSAIVIKGEQILSREPLRFRDEFVRHKILDIIGDLTLLGMPFRGHIIAVRPGHALNAQFVNSLQRRAKERGASAAGAPPAAEERASTVLNIRQVINLIPHRYPFLLIDRVLEAEEEHLVALKNVSANEPFFMGHFPGRPVFPGVLQIEAMAQAAGVMMLRRAGMAGKLAFFMSCDRVKFRRIVEPGDQLRVEVNLLRHRAGKIAVAGGVCTVGGQVVSSAELMFTIAEDRVD
ncbi:MAG: bifunctional UDP-3-O-[3-hydroxymyristoyl] N-acetylglucosamine deacetylase/3-hydroxyacyl-ACP dehydratase [Puniceicoccales bacterium]|jgi:UDP-3-O-[3-hydroxymyristoyl] N-acetylglucosamine deacetylase/3-hydroxyacyl-[acyl-carrier-protein] dehydratase|nr:bifunctional UDP-3-O-[3-hydroxymyristoyl] N-acetylglucosamine deacetylase/3-hydroxyacyl-ACP dehydratase [Puniceicoccales bacterium]